MFVTVIVDIFISDPNCSNVWIVQYYMYGTEWAFWVIRRVTAGFCLKLYYHTMQRASREYSFKQLLTIYIC